MEAFSTSDESTSSVEASRSRVKTSVLPAPGQASGRGPARVFGTSTPDSFATFDPVTSSWRTSQLSLLEDSTSFSGTWPRAGMTRNGIASRLAPLAPLTAATASGLWPTPTTKDNMLSPSMQKWPAHRNLMWPTPTARDHKDTGENTNYAHLERKSRLAGVVEMRRRREQFPTPTKSDGTGGPGRASSTQGGSNLRTVTGGPLNPTWLEWLMGFPLGWTVSAAWETRLSRKSRNGSAGGSSRTKRK
jgi:hypothetical protein